MPVVSLQIDSFFFPPPAAFRVPGFEALSFPKMRTSVPKTVICRQKRRAKAVCTAQRSHFHNLVHILALASTQRLVFETTIWICFLFFRFAGHMIGPIEGDGKGKLDQGQIPALALYNVV